MRYFFDNFIMLTIFFIIIMFIYILFNFIFLLVRQYILNYKIKNILKILTQLYDPDKYLDKINKLLLKNNKNKNKVYLTMYKIVGLNYKGDFESSYTILKSIDINKLSKTILLIYYNSLLFTLILMGKINEAKELYTVNSYIFNQQIKNAEIKNAVKDTLAYYEYFTGNINQSEQILNEINESEIQSINLASKYYLLALIYYDKEDCNRSLECITKVCTYAPNSYFELKAKEIIKPKEEFHN